MKDDLLKRLQDVKTASAALRSAEPGPKNAVLTTAARLLESESALILDANSEDLKALPENAPTAFRDRLLLKKERLAQMAESLRQVAALADPIGEEVEARTLANGLLIRRERAPLGVLLMIFESRPNVALEAFSLAFKAGNAIVLRGGKESMRTTTVLYGLISKALAAHGFSENCLWGITDPDRSITQWLLAQDRLIDVVVPRGGDSLIEYVSANTRIPLIKNHRGLCHVYIDEDADPKMAASIVENAKTQRPGVCNAMETLLVHEAIAPGVLPAIHARLEPHGVQWFACAETMRHLQGKSGVHSASNQAWDTEYLDLMLSCRVVGSLDAAIEHIEAHGSKHSEAIITNSADRARRFQARVDAAAVYWNASTRFTDGFELGLGGELGVSTQKLHVRGPIGLRELTCIRWIIDGSGQTRG